MKISEYFTKLYIIYSKCNYELYVLHYVKRFVYCEIGQKFIKQKKIKINSHSVWSLFNTQLSSFKRLCFENIVGE